MGIFTITRKPSAVPAVTAVFWYGATSYAIAFLLPWFPWKYYHEGGWLSGCHLMVSLCAFQSMPTFIQQAECALFAEVFTRHESRPRLIKLTNGCTGRIYKHPFLWPYL